MIHKIVNRTELVFLELRDLEMDGRPLTDFKFVEFPDMLAMHIKETETGRYRELRFGTGQVDFVRGIHKALSMGTRLFVAECWFDGAADWQTGLQEINRFVREQFSRAQEKTPIVR